jgi:type I restriction enzyme S subunit
VKPKQLLAHFERISGAPDAIARLRSFVLDLAVRGRLVEQRATEEPQSKRGAGSSKTVRVVGSADPEFAWALPTGWKLVPLEELGGSSGLFVDGDWVESKDQDPNGDVRLIQLADVGLGVYRNRSSRFMNSTTAGRLNCTYLTPGDILIARMPDPLGRACIFPGDLKPSVTVVDVAILRPGVRANPTFIVHAINSPPFARSVAAKAAGTTRSRISRGNLGRLAIPLPPLAEQHRIVAKVNELMALCDRLEAAQAERESRRDRLVSASLQRLSQPAADPPTFRDHARFHLDHLPRLATRVEHVQQLRKTILDLAVRGRLVEQDPNDEPPRLNVDTAGSGHSERPTPRAWVWARIGALLNGDSQNGYSRRPDGAADGIPILRISAGTMRRDGIVAEEEHKLIGKVTADERRQFALQPGDLLACRFNGNREFVGRLSLYLGYLGINPIYPDKLIRLRLAGCVLPELVRYFAQSDAVRAEIEGYCATTVGNWGISASNLKRVLIPLPPLAEQHRIVVKVDQLMALCDQLEAQLDTAQTGRRRLLEAVIHEALAPAA